MLRNEGETISAKGGLAQFQPTKDKVHLSDDLATALGWNAGNDLLISSFLHPDDSEDLIKSLHEISTGEMSGAVSRTRVCDFSGGFRTLDWSFFRTTEPSTVCGVGMLVSKESTANTSRLLKEVVEGMHDGFAIYDPEDRLILSNSAFRSVLPGFLPAKLHGLTFEQLAELCRRFGVYDDVGAEPEKYIATRIAAHRSGNSVMFQTLRSGRVERIEERRLPSGHIVALHADVTDLHRDSIASKRKTTATLDFFSVISHELRTPLVGLIGMLDELGEAKSDDERARIMKIIRRSGENLMTIANGALDLAKIEEGHMEIEEETFDPVESLTPVVERYALISRNKNLGFVADMKGDIGLRAGDPVRYAQIVENLLSNAIKFTEKGEVSLRVARESGDVITIEVTDTGIGIPPAFITRMMQPFTQADPTLTRKYGGTGLGLSVVSHLVSVMGGTIKCTSFPEHGATFTVHLPLKPATLPETTDAQNPETRSFSFSGKRVLIADDNEINRTVLEAFCQRMQFETILASDGEEALRKALSTDFDLLLLDISMPKIDGVEVVSQLRQRQKYSAIPIIAVTANVLAHELTIYEEAGFDACLTKPFRRHDLGIAVARFLVPDA